ncbi:MAG: DUF368 domain-containing protein [Desulfobacterales bacterium]|nr:DUF368 domain-containing protein [Desulfobacterales bacterium]
MDKTLLAHIKLAFKGIAMGAADVIPGVSGGTIAFISGIYQELLDSIKSLNLHSLKLILKGEFKQFWQQINGSFLLTLGGGIGISILSLAKVMEYLLNNYAIEVWSFFFGLIIASTIYVSKDISKWNGATVLSIIAGAFVAYFITTITPAEANQSTLFIFLSGAIAVCAMVLPGISGSFILVLLGMYKFILGALSSFNIVVIMTFIAGAGIGIVVFSNFLSWLLKRAYNLTIGLLTGFMIGSLNKVWPWKETVKTIIDRHGETRVLIETNIWPFQYEQITSNESHLILAIVMATIGFMFIFTIQSIAKKDAMR